MGICLDLGVLLSVRYSVGIYLQEDAPLDMRMDQREIFYSDIVNGYELIDIPHYQGITGKTILRKTYKHIVRRKPIETTGELSEQKQPSGKSTHGGHPANGLPNIRELNHGWILRKIQSIQ